MTFPFLHVALIETETHFEWRMSLSENRCDPRLRKGMLFRDMRYAASRSIPAAVTRAASRLRA
jgi:hypothetical protein